MTYKTPSLAPRTQLPTPAILPDASGRTACPVGLPERFLWMKGHQTNVTQVMAHEEGYFQQCAAGITVREIPHLDLPLVAEAHLSSSRDSVSPSPPEFRIVTGVVYEPTTEGRRGVANRLVVYQFGIDPAAVTRTDDQGRFLICGLPQSHPVSIAEAFGGAITVPPKSDADIEIEAK